MDLSYAMGDSADGADGKGSARGDLARGAVNPLQSPRFNAISRSLQRIFGKVVEEPLPERLQDLIRQVERAGPARK